jgi:hypothetical protein
VKIKTLETRMAKPNYRHQKHLREENKKKRNEEKKQRKNKPPADPAAVVTEDNVSAT